MFGWIPIPPRSIGFDKLVFTSGMNLFILFIIFSDNWGIFKLYFSNMSIASIVEPPPIPITPTLRVFGKRVKLKAEASAASSFELLTIQLPVCFPTAFHISLFPAKPPVWDKIAFFVASPYPALQRITGFLFKLHFLTIFIKFRPCSIDLKFSMYKPIILVWSSVKKYSKNSTGDKSNELPIEIDFDVYNPYETISWEIFWAIPPDWNIPPKLPVFLDCSKAKWSPPFGLYTPIQLGPIIRMLYFRATCIVWFSSVSFPTSRKPEE